MRRPLSLAFFAALASCEVVAGLGDVPDALPVATGDASPEAASDASTDGAPPPAEGGTSATVGPCHIFPPDNPWNRDVSNDPIDSDAMTQILPNMDLTAPLHPDWGDFGSNGTGIPFNISSADPVPVAVSDTQDSDPLACDGGGGAYCYPIPPSAVTNAQVTIVLDTRGAPDGCTLFELCAASKDSGDNGWSATLGAIFPLGSDTLRGDGRHSCDQAGLPILPGLVRYDELTQGLIQHAIRLTMRNTFLGYIHPAESSSGSNTAGSPPMGLRLRLNAGYSFPGTPTSPYTATLITALQHYGVVLADVGSDWFMTGEQNAGFSSTVVDPIVDDLRSVHGSDFEIVQSGMTLTTGL